MASQASNFLISVGQAFRTSSPSWADIGRWVLNALVIAEEKNAQRIVLDSWSAYERLGSPDGDISLVMTVLFLSLSPKSNAVYKAEHSSVKYAKKHFSELPPKHITNAPTNLMSEFGWLKVIFVEKSQ